MMQAQIMDADFYPIVVDTHPAVRRRAAGRAHAWTKSSMAGSHAAERAGRTPAMKIVTLLFCGVLLLLLLARVFQWADRRNETELLVLVNSWNSVDYSGFVPELVDIGDGKQVDTRCAEALQQMLDDCYTAGYSPTICSAYRTREVQEQLYQNKIERLIAAGMSAQEAPAIAALEVARPGTSEHELGLAVDIVDRNHQALDQSQERTETQQWLMENSWRYGFILRYPNGSSGITGII